MIKKNYALSGLPEEIKFCKKCVISNQRPNNVVEFKSKDNQKKGIRFSSDDSICDACKYNEKKKAPGISRVQKKTSQVHASHWYMERE